MAVFSVRNVEGMRQVCVDLGNETVRARNGVMSNTRGTVRLVPRLPSPRDFIRSLYNKEARLRPEYTGTGTVLLQPSLGGFHLMNVEPDEPWIFEPGVYWASEGTVNVRLHRDRFWPSLWLGEGILNWKTRIDGEGQVVVSARGPVETVNVVDGEFRAQGRIVLGRTSGLRFTSQRPAPFPRNLFSGQRRLRVLQGTGKVLVCFTPYWNEHVYRRMTGETITQSLFE